MARRPIFNSPEVEIVVDTGLGIIQANWKGFLKINNVLEGMENLLEGVNTHGVQRHISDQSQLRILPKEIKEYMVKDGLASMEAAGLKKVGIIRAHDYFAQIAVNKINKKANVKDLDIQTFSSEKDCVTWLIS